MANVRHVDKLKAAQDTVAEKYHPFIALIKGNPYMNVDGRNLMAIDDAKATGDVLTIHTEFFEVADVPCIRATVTIGTRTATGIASIHFGGEGADETNPIENGETSAVGRALGFLGYGLFGYGIASADEMHDAGTRHATAQRDKAPSEKQIAYIRTLSEQLGFGGKQVAERLAGVTTSAQASEVIDRLRNLQEEKKEPDAKQAEIDATTRLLAYAEEHSMTPRLHALMLERDLKLQDLGPDTARHLHEQLRADVAEVFATEGLANTQDDLWRQQAAEAEREPGEEG